MKAFVLAGGLGTRLKSRFGDLPKGLAPLGGRPFLVRQLEWLASHQVSHVVICAGYGAEAVQLALGDGSAMGVRIEYSVEAQPLGTGGALKLAERFVDGPALLVNGDTLAECDPWILERARWEHGAEGALALFEVADPSARGRVELDRDGRVIRFAEKDTSEQGTSWVNGGLMAVTPRLWRRLPDGASSLERDLLPALAADGNLCAVRLPGTFYDIGTPADWERAERRFGA
ncbi:MAG: sugar phosphate nucleotidyltransferase [Candidatus Eiseniibacteriota bacterium]